MKKRSFSLWIWLLITTVPASAQLSVLFVDDSDDTFGNGELFAAALDSVGYPVTYFDAVDSADSPTDLYLANFDLVIWYTSANGVNLQLWNGLDEDNARLKAYLNAGGKLWIVGLDYLYDRYVTPPVSFTAGEFPYDYMGLTAYDLQSYGDDGNLGVSLVFPDTAQAIPGLNTLTWQFSTLWWVDGVSLRPEAQAIYRMGGSGYVFADSVCGAWYDNGTYQVLSYFFDLAVVADFEMLKATTLPVMVFFESLVSDIDVPHFSASDFGLYPNPVTGQFAYEFSLEAPARVEASLWDMQGRNYVIMPEKNFPTGHHVLPTGLPATWPEGMYWLRLEVDGEVSSRMLRYSK